MYGKVVITSARNFRQFVSTVGDGLKQMFRSSNQTVHLEVPDLAEDGKGNLIIAPPFVYKDELTTLVNAEVEKRKLDNRFASFILRMFEYESPSANHDGKAVFINELEGTYRGLGQFSRYSWNLLKKAYPEILAAPYSAVGVPVENVRAMIAYLTDSRKVHRNRYNEDILDDFAIAYLYHQQGASAARTYLVTGELEHPKQSGASKELFKEIDYGERYV
jgi:hypothetical protein